MGRCTLIFFSDEMKRLGLIDSKLWRVARVLIDRKRIHTHRTPSPPHTHTHTLSSSPSPHTHTDSDLCPTYPTHLVMPICTPDMDIMRGASLYKEGRFPTLTWLHPSGTALLRGASTKDERYIPLYLHITLICVGGLYSCILCTMQSYI